MREPFKKSLNQIPLEEAHGGTGSRQLLLSKADSISKYLEAMTKGYLRLVRNLTGIHTIKLMNSFLFDYKANSVRVIQRLTLDIRKG